MTTTTPTRFVPELKDIGQWVDVRIRQLQDGYLKDLSEAVSTLAKLRRGAGRPIEAVPELIGLTLDHHFYEKFSPHGSHIEDAEAAAHEAMTLYALHQQSKRDQRMHRRGRDLGGAVRRLMPTGDIDEPLRKKFVQAGSAVDHAIRADRLRGIVQLLRAGDVPLDYGLLADQLYEIRTPAGAARVRREWGRGFQAYRHEKNTAPDGDDEDSRIGTVD